MLEQAHRYLRYWRILRDQRRVGLDRAEEVASGYLLRLPAEQAAALRAEYGLPEAVKDG